MSHHDLAEQIPNRSLCLSFSMGIHCRCYHRGLVLRRVIAIIPTMGGTKAQVVCYCKMDGYRV